MQLMTWQMARLGSRFGLVFEPHRKRVLHSALGRFFDQPLDLAVGLIDADGQERVLPFSEVGTPFYACEQFERINSITYRGFDEKQHLKFELNVHCPFYPQNEKVCIAPLIYLELRVTWTQRVRWVKKQNEPGETVKLFIRLNRPETDITVNDGRIDLNYEVPLRPTYERRGYDDTAAMKKDGKIDQAEVAERIQSINTGSKAFEDEHGKGLSLDLPITEEGSGTKWRLVWAAHTDVNLMEVRGTPARFRYVRHWPTLDSVMEEAVANRDDNLAHARRFEKLLEQAPLVQSRRHLIAQGFQSYLSNTFWCDVADGTEWFSNWEGSCFFHSTVDVEYNISMLYFAIWPDLLRKTIDQWVHYGKEHAASGGAILSHDMGRGLPANGQSYPHDMPVEENANFLLLLQAYCHWTGDKEPIRMHADFVAELAQYLLWTDRDNSGFPSEGTANTIDDASPAIQYARKQTYLAIKRVTALQAAADLLERAGNKELASKCLAVAADAIPKIEREAWLGDHFAVCVDREAAGVTDVWTGKPLMTEEIKGWDDYSIYSSNGLLLPQMIGRDCPFDGKKMQSDIVSAIRETVTPYGCGHSSSDSTNVWVSQNVWRDLTGRYLGAIVPPLDSRYWDLQVFSNTTDQSFGFIDTYIGNELCFYPRGAVTFGHFLAGPRIRIDRLTDGVAKISICPDRYRNSRWPLLPLADWAAGKIPVCVVDGEGQVTIEGELEEVLICGPDASRVAEEV